MDSWSNMTHIKDEEDDVRESEDEWGDEKMAGILMSTECLSTECGVPGTECRRLSTGS